MDVQSNSGARIVPVDTFIAVISASLPLPSCVTSTVTLPDSTIYSQRCYRHVLSTLVDRFGTEGPHTPQLLLATAQRSELIQRKNAFLLVPRMLPSANLLESAVRRFIQFAPWFLPRSGGLPEDVLAMLVVFDPLIGFRK